MNCSMLQLCKTKQPLRLGVIGFDGFEKDVRYLEKPPKNTHTCVLNHPHLVLKRKPMRPRCSGDASGKPAPWAAAFAQFFVGS